MKIFYFACIIYLPAYRGKLRGEFKLLYRENNRLNGNQKEARIADNTEKWRKNIKLSRKCAELVEKLLLFNSLFAGVIAY